MVKLSVIVPTYKTAKYLSKCLDSIINQTFKDIEIIVISDGPEEDNIICEKYANKYDFIKVLYGNHEGNGGARNLGLDSATGEYIAFVDSDDWIEPNTYELAIEKMNEHNPDFVSWCANIICDDIAINNEQLNIAKNYHKAKLTGLIELDDIVLRQTTVTLWNKLFKREIIEDNLIRFPKKLHYEDNEFFFKYFLCSQKGYYLNDGLYNYLQRLDSQMYSQFQQKSIKVNDCIEIYRNVYNFCKEKNIIDKHTILLADFFNSALNKYRYSPDTKLTRKKLVKLAREIDNSIIKDKKISLVQKNKLHEIEYLNAPKYELGNRVLGLIYSKKQTQINFLGIKIKVKRGK